MKPIGIFGSGVLVLSLMSFLTPARPGLPNVGGTALHTKEITVFDKKRENSVVLRVSSNDSYVVGDYTAAHFDLKPVRAGAARTERESNEGEPADERLPEGPVHGDAATHFEILRRDLASGTSGVELTVRHPDGLAAPKDWCYAFFHSSANDNYASIKRHSFWHRVYFGCKYKKYSSSSWSTIVSTWRKLSNNETWYTVKDPCYQLRFHVAYKKSSHFTVRFDETAIADPKK